MGLMCNKETKLKLFVILFCVVAQSRLLVSNRTVFTLQEECLGGVERLGKLVELSRLGLFSHNLQTSIDRTTIIPEDIDVFVFL